MSLPRKYRQEITVPESELDDCQEDIKVLQEELEETKRTLHALQNFYDQFEDILDWMQKQNLIEVKDIDEVNPLLTYKNVLIRLSASV